MKGQITIEGYNDRGEEHFNDCPAKHVTSIAKALRSLLYFELGYGGAIKEVTPNSLTVVLSILKCKNTTIFSGDETAMKYLFTGVYIYDLLSKENVNVDVERLLITTGGLPLFTTSLGPNVPEVLSGHRYSSISAILSVVSIQKEKDFDKVKDLLSITKDEELYLELDKILES